MASSDKDGLDTTVDLLAMTLPGVGSPEKGYVDSEEDEVFFGQQSSKEEQGLKSKNLKLLRRTLQGVIRPQNSPKNVPFNPIQEEDIENNIDVEKENACVAPPASDLSEERAKTPLKDIQRHHQKVASAVSPKPTPSPRKINLGNPDEGEEMLIPPTPKTRQNLTPVKTTTPANRVDQLRGNGSKREIKSASKLLANLPIQQQDCYDEDEEERENSILDVNNDQLFDDSIFTEYDASNLSSLAITGAATAKSWQQVAKQERRKTGNFVEAPSIASLVSACSEDVTTTCVPETPVSSLSLDQVDQETRDAEAVRRRDSSASTFSDYFNTTREEKILFQRYGEDYDEIVGQMPRSEKMRLKQEVGSMEAEDPNELIQQPPAEVSNAAASISTHSFIKVVEKDEDLLKSPPFCPENSIFMPPTAVAPQQGSIEPSLTESVAAKTQASKSNPEMKTPGRFLTAGKSSNPEMFRTPTFSRVLQPSAAPSSGGKTMPNYLRPTQSSRLKASPSKSAVSVSSSPALPSGGRMFAHPLGGSSSGVATFKFDPSSPAPGNFLFSKPSHTPQSSKLPVRRVAASGIDMKSIVSPVSQYIKSVPVQPLVAKIRPKASKFLEEELHGLSDEDNEEQVSAKTQQFTPIPDRHYVSSRVALEQQVAPDVQHRDLPRAFGMGNTTEATVVKHLGRMRVPKNLDLQSPDGARLKKAAPRESMAVSNNTLDENSMELSIREVKEIKKLTTLPKKL